MYVAARLMAESGQTGDSLTFTAGLEEIEPRVRDWAASYLGSYPWDSADVSIWSDQAQADGGVNAAINYRLIF